ncbi:hypothetical protein PR048_027422 [Dryococelus australis]|uniref:ELYS beta-propeller domain-containing protein n=1 Tax=Dryococelus australis TaxID=614101 RepID=A0ABQ9GFE9_9NEOP|nr:hypothetical protein PR048_027422 [Dryococelus australis]
MDGRQTLYFPDLSQMLVDLKCVWQKSTLGSQYTWLCQGPRLYLISTVDGSQVNLCTFASMPAPDPDVEVTTEVTCVVHLATRREGKIRHVVVGLNHNNQTGLVCIFDMHISRIVRAVHMPKPVTSLSVVDHGLGNWESRQVMQKTLRDMDGILAVGLSKGEVFLVDLRRMHVCVRHHDHTCAHTVSAGCGIRPERERKNERVIKALREGEGRDVSDGFQQFIVLIVLPHLRISLLTTAKQLYGEKGVVEEWKESMSEAYRIGPSVRDHIAEHKGSLSHPARSRQTSQSDVTPSTPAQAWASRAQYISLHDPSQEHQKLQSSLPAAPEAATTTNNQKLQRLLSTATRSSRGSYHQPAATPQVAVNGYHQLQSFCSIYHQLFNTVYFLLAPYIDKQSACLAQNPVFQQSTPTVKHQGLGAQPQGIFRDEFDACYLVPVTPGSTHLGNEDRLRTRAGDHICVLINTVILVCFGSRDLGVSEVERKATCCLATAEAPSKKSVMSSCLWRREIWVALNIEVFRVNEGEVRDQGQHRGVQVTERERAAEREMTEGRLCFPSTAKGVSAAPGCEAGCGPGGGLSWPVANSMYLREIGMVVDKAAQTSIEIINHNVSVSCLHAVPRILGLFVGYDEGFFQLWNMRNLKLESGLVQHWVLTGIPPSGSVAFEGRGIKPQGYRGQGWGLSEVELSLKLVEGGLQWRCAVLQVMEEERLSSAD